MQHRYHSSADLVDRLCYAANRKDRSVIFLVGSALSRPDHLGAHGVPDVAGMIDLIRSELTGTDAAPALDHLLASEPSHRHYQEASTLLHGRRGQEMVNRIVRSAVWRALNTANWPSILPETAPQDADTAVCRTLEQCLDAWVLPSAVDSFGRLLATCADPFGHSVLTTNFDPLIEISVRQHQGNCYRTVLAGDGRLGQTVADGAHVVHLHGYWCGYDTLHTPQQLTQPRPQLRQSLSHVISNGILVVLGYGGWDDVITTTLAELLTDSTRTPEILWAFHSDDGDHIEATQPAVLDALRPGIDRGRVQLYRGIDCATLLSDLITDLAPSYPLATTLYENAGVQTAVNEDMGGSEGLRQVHVHIAFPLTQISSAASDSPLLASPWVGRNTELSLLGSSVMPVTFITGLGGQGKSALAGRFLQLHAMSPSPRYAIWDWRDCREEADRLGTQMLRLIERLSNGSIDASRIEATDVRAVVGILFHVLRERRALLVFDNVDQYVDLETLQPIKGLDVLLAEAQARHHQSLFLFTCRPDIQVDESRALRVTLTGLSESDMCALLAARGIPQSDQDLAGELHRTTDGHPLWTNLVMMQALRHREGLRGALDLIGHGAATLPDTTRTIWRTLNDQQRTVLRTMAELDRSEPETRLLDLLPGANVNRVNRALRALRSFHLIEMRTRPEGEPLLGLHPIIREFVRTEFPKKDREKYVGPILGFLDRMIGRFKGLLQKEPSYDILEHWVRKAELQIAIGKLEEATATMEEIGEPLVNRGYHEDVIRLGRRLFAEVDWAEACAAYRDFDAVFRRCVTAMVQVEHSETAGLLERYESAIPGKSTQFILLCDLRCYAHWYAGRYDAAVHWGERGVELKERSAVDTVFSSQHNLALAKRDRGQVEDALEIFLEGEPIERVAKPGERIADKGAHFYGNIGRCLFLSGRTEEALTCYVKSAQLLEEGRTRTDELNRGYIRSWIAELMTMRGEVELAAAFYRAAACIWMETAPPRGVEVAAKLTELVQTQPAVNRYCVEPQWKVEEIVGGWLNRQ